MPSMYRNVLQSLLDFLIDSNNSLADAEVFRRFEWEVVDFNTSFAKEYVGNDASHIGDKPPMLFSVFGVVRAVVSFFSANVRLLTRA